jgi:hypothetical protein
MLKKSCPYHKTPVNHTLEQCDMLKKLKDRYGEPERGELMGADKNSSRRR